MMYLQLTTFCSLGGGKGRSRLKMNRCFQNGLHAVDWNRHGLGAGSWMGSSSADDASSIHWLRLWNFTNSSTLASAWMRQYMDEQNGGDSRLVLFKNVRACCQVSLLGHFFLYMYPLRIRSWFWFLGVVNMCWCAG